MCFLTSFFVIPLFGTPFYYTPWGIISGLFWVPAGVAAIYAVKNAGLAVSQGLWSSIIVIVSFTWGIFIFHEGVKSITVATAAVVLMIVGLWGMSFYSSPSFSPARNYEEVRSIASLVDIVPSVSSTAAGVSGVGVSGEQYNGTCTTRNYTTNGTTSVDHGDESESSGIFSHITNHISLTQTAPRSNTNTRDKDNYLIVHSPFGSYDNRTMIDQEIGTSNADSAGNGDRVANTTVPSDDEDISMEDSSRNNNIYDYQQNYDDGISYASSITPTSDAARAVHQRKSKLKSRSSSMSLSPRDSDTKATSTTATMNSTTHQQYLENRVSTDKESDPDNDDHDDDDDYGEDYFFENPYLHSNENGNEYPNLNSTQELQDHQQNTHRPTTILSKRTLGLLSAVFNGVWGGSIMVPMHYAPPEAHGTGYVISFAIGATIITICLWIGRFLYHYVCLKKTVRSSYDSLPPFHFRIMWRPGGTAGLLWSIGNLSSMISVQYLGEGVGYSLTQASMLVSGIWGIFYFREVVGFGVRMRWFLSALITIGGILLLSFEHDDDGGDVSRSRGV
eukprot:CAMPEP_0203665838 /NCGR_PEP_ID=MMETSP0090-20130426/2987_1 /ASSEMBLY_ACC=CAM_ASM_001088 /TAXON_ID=426623 /ORGANISM="Chaetoceros affinis, Strain CCMP159" /LENGTH=560 /DNA_ID=CAMNT_0050529537 /DNA_START=550 /DNA_END=2232 /DNA_ORIENTATION=-